MPVESFVDPEASDYLAALGVVEEQGVGAIRERVAHTDAANQRLEENFARMDPSSVPADLREFDITRLAIGP